MELRWNHTSPSFSVGSVILSFVVRTLVMLRTSPLEFPVQLSHVTPNLVVRALVTFRESWST